MKFIATIWTLLLLTASVHGQTLSVLDQESKEPLPSVTIISNQPKEVAVTNLQGKADISEFKGLTNIQLRLVGYKTLHTSYAHLGATSFQIHMESDTLTFEEVVVSATRWQQYSANVPQRISTVDPETIGFQNPQTAADLLGVSGKVFIQKSQQGGGSPMIRGFATNRLLYTVDGVRMNTAIFRGGNLQSVISLDPFAVNNTEVLFGPGSVIYGSDAIGGVMSFQTLRPQLSLTDEQLISGNASFRYATANTEKTGHFDINVGGSKWAFLTSISANDYGHLRQGSHGPDDYLKPYYVQRIDSLDRQITQDDPLLQIPTGYTQMNLMQKLRYKPNSKWDFQYGLHYSETSDYGRYDRHNRMRNGLPRYGQWNYGPQKWMMNLLTISHSTPTLLYDQLTTRIAYQFFEESRIDRDRNEPLQRNRIENVFAYSLNIDLVKTIGQKNQLFYGVEIVRDDVESEAYNRNIYNGQKNAILTRYPESDWSSYGLYVKDQYRFTDRFYVQGGLRYNQFVINAKFDPNYIDLPFTKAELNNGALTGNLGFTYHPSENWIIKSNISTGFRSPNVDDIGKVFDSEPGSVVVPNPDLKAEYAYNADLGISKMFNDRLKIDLTGYYTHLDNALVRRNFSLNGQDSLLYDGTLSQIQAIQNAAVAKRYGIQASLELKLPGHFTFFQDLNFQDGEDELDDGSTSPPRHAAPLFGVTRLTYDHQKVKLQLYANYQGERAHTELAASERDKVEIYALDDQGNTYSPAWYTLNFKGQYQINKQFTVTAGIENITDQRYRPYSSGISGPGRNFLISLKSSF